MVVLPASTVRAAPLAALIEAISAGRHDAVFATHPMMIASDLAQVEAFDRLCRQHGVRVRYRWAGGPKDPRALFDRSRSRWLEFRAGRYVRGNEWDSTWQRDETEHL
jgi:hypothetical protein